MIPNATSNEAIVILFECEEFDFIRSDIYYKVLAHEAVPNAGLCN